MAAFFIFLMTAVAITFLSYNYADFMGSTQPNIAKAQHISSISKKWIVVTSISHPTEDIKRLAEIPDWQLVVVADLNTPKNWSMEGVHFLSVEEQKLLGYNILTILPNNSYTRKNIGYLYAIEHGAEWIYDTDDDNKPYAVMRKNSIFGLGLDQFDYTEQISGLRYGCANQENRSLESRLFNPYQFFGSPHMWPRGFPLSYLQNHTNGHDGLCLCHKMRTASVQQGLVHKDPDVDAIYRLLHADKKTGLHENFNKIAPPIVLESVTTDLRGSLRDLCRYVAPKAAFACAENFHYLPPTLFRNAGVRSSQNHPPTKVMDFIRKNVDVFPGTYCPWNSQNTLFHKTAFFTLFLPVTVAFRVTDIWRSYFAQKLLHLVGENIAFYPVNAIQVRNAHDYLKDFESERDLYLKSDAIVEFLDEWECEHEEIPDCTLSLAEEFSNRHFWESGDAEAIGGWISDLKKIGYQFPARANRNDYRIFNNETVRGQNCRAADLELETLSKNVMTRKSTEKLEAFGTIADWCSEAGYTDLLHKLPSPSQLARFHANNEALRNLRDSVLIVTNNYPWNYTIGLLQRIYQPYFGLTIFCGSWFPDKYIDSEEFFPKRIRPFNYINLSVEEMHEGYYAYYCLAKAKDLRLGNIRGYFVMADDTTFNFWNVVNPEMVMHPSGDTYLNKGGWWLKPSGKAAAIKARMLFEQTYIHDPTIQAIWQQFKGGLRRKNEKREAGEVLTEVDGWTVGDFYYIPSAELDYYSGLMEVFFEAGLFHEIAMTKYLHTVTYETARFDYLNGTGGRDVWHENYKADLMMMHPIKLSFSGGNLTERTRFCDSVLVTFSRNLLSKMP